MLDANLEDSTPLWPVGNSLSTEIKWSNYSESISKSTARNVAHCVVPGSFSRQNLSFIYFTLMFTLYKVRRPLQVEGCVELGFYGPRSTSGPLVFLIQPTED